LSKQSDVNELHAPEVVYVSVCFTAIHRARSLSVWRWFLHWPE